MIGGVGAALGAAAISTGSRVSADPGDALAPRLSAAASPTRTLTIGAAAFVPMDHADASTGVLSITAGGGLRCGVGALNAVAAAVQLPGGSRISKVEFVSNPAGSNPTVAFASTDLSGQMSTIESATTAQVNDVTTTTLTVDHVVDASKAYMVSFTALYGSITLFGVRITYTDPTGGFVPLDPTPRVFNTRDSQSPKLAPGEERIVPLTVPGGATAVLNLTITETDSPGGYVACFPADTAWPGNSNINWFGSNQNLANTTFCATDASGQIRVRGGGAGAHIIIDVIGYLS
ncbi:MAG: hypothetical protein AB7L17_03300 [Ilumatobacteraceae bacterium]